jgi:hypothetical protein
MISRTRLDRLEGAARAKGLGNRCPTCTAMLQGVDGHRVLDAGRMDVTPRCASCGAPLLAGRGDRLPSRHVTKCYVGVDLNAV